MATAESGGVGDDALWGFVVNPTGGFLSLRGFLLAASYRSNSGRTNDGIMLDSGGKSVDLG